MFRGTNRFEPLDFEESKSKSRKDIKKCAAVIVCVLCLLVLWPLLYSSVFISRTDDSIDRTEIRFNTMQKNLDEQQAKIHQLAINFEGVDLSFRSINTAINEIRPPISKNELELYRLNEIIQENALSLENAKQQIYIQAADASTLSQENQMDIKALETAISLLLQQVQVLEMQIQAVESKSNQIPLTEEPNDVNEQTDEIFIVIIDFGAFVDVYERRRSKIFPCNTEEATGRPSISRVYNTIEALYTMKQDKTISDFNILLATTESRKHYFDDLGSILLVLAPDNSGYADLSNAAAMEIGEENGSNHIMIFMHPGSIPTSPNFISEMTTPLFDDSHVDVGIVTARVVDSKTKLLHNCGTEVSYDYGNVVPHLRWKGYWKEDRRAIQPSFVPAASPYGAWSIPVSLYHSIGGMVSDEFVEFTPSFHVYDLCLAIADEAEHYDKDIHDDDDDIEGICQLQERHKVLYVPRATMEITPTLCENGLLSISPFSFEWIEFTERWSTFLDEIDLSRERKTNATMVWEISSEDCSELYEIVSAIENELPIALAMKEDSDHCEADISSVQESILRMKSQKEFLIPNIWLTSYQVGHQNISESMSVSLASNRSPFFIGRVTTNFEPSELSQEQREELYLFSQIWVPSSALIDNLEEAMFDSGNIHVIAPTIDTNFFDSSANTLETSDSFSFSVILHIQDGEDVLEARSMVEAALIDNVYNIVLLTSPELYQSVNATVLRTPVLSYAASHYEMWEVLKGAAVFVSLGEGNSIPAYSAVLRALAMEVPIIAVREGWHLDILNDQNSFLVDNKDSDVFSEVINQIWDGVSYKTEENGIKTAQGRKDILHNNLFDTTTNMIHAINQLQ